MNFFTQGFDDLNAQRLAEYMEKQMPETNEGGMASEEDFNTEAQQVADVPEESEQLPGLRNSREIVNSSVKKNAKHQQYLNEAKQHLENGMRNKMYFSYWDFAGQSTYYSTHQAFLSARAVYLLVIDLSKHWGETLSDNLSFRLGTGKQCTVAESLQFWASSIKTFTSDENGGRAPIILVGTHGDMVDDETAKIRFDEAKKIIEMDMVIWVKVNNSTSGDVDITELRNAILEVGLGIADEPVPARWMELEHAINIEKQNGKDVIHFHDLKRLNTNLDFPVEDEGLKAFLEHGHCRGRWMYFPGGVDDDDRDLIILKPVALAKFLNSLMRSSLVAEQNAVNIDTTNANGIVDEEFLTTAATILFKKEQIVADIEGLTKVLIRLKILMKYTNEVTHKTVFIMPSLLPVQATPAPQSTPKERFPKLKIAFEGNFLPVGFFHLFLAAVVTDVADIRISTIENTPQIFGLNGTLYLEHEAILVDIRWDRSSIIIEVQNYSNKHSLKDTNVSRLIYDDIDSVIQNTLEVYRQKANYTLSIKCPNCTDAEDNYLSLHLLSQKDEVLCAARHAVTMNDINNKHQFSILTVS